jgi:hypothetical protein
MSSTYNFRVLFFFFRSSSSTLSPAGGMTIVHNNNLLYLIWMTRGEELKAWITNYGKEMDTEITLNGTYRIHVLKYHNPFS